MASRGIRKITHSAAHGTALALYFQLASYTLVAGCKVALFHSGKMWVAKPTQIRVYQGSGSTELIAITMHP